MDRKLYQFGDSPCCMKVRIILAEKKLPWEECFIESWKFDHFQPEYLDLNPYGIVPTLIDQGHTLLQSNVIAEYLEDAYPTPPMRPTEPHLAAEMRKWMTIEQDHLFRHIVTVSFGTMMKYRVEGFGLENLKKWSKRHPDQKKAEDYLKRLTAPANEVAIAAAWNELRRHFKMLDDTLDQNGGPWICGSQFTLAEACLAGIVDRIIYLDREDIFEGLDNVTPWLERLMEHPSYRAAEHRFSARMWGPKKPVSEYPDLVR